MMFGSRKKVQYLPLASTNHDTQVLEPQSKKWSSIVAFKFWILALIFGGYLLFCNYFEAKSITRGLLNKFSKLQKFPQPGNPLTGYVINTPGCRIPDMDPFDPSIKPYISKPGKLNCNKIPPLFQSNLTSIYMVTQFLPFYNIRNLTELNCCYEEFKRLVPTGSMGDTKVTYSNKCIKVVASADLNESEFVKILCKNTNGKQVYEDYFPFAPVKKKINTAAFSQKQKPNILIIGLDAMSRLNLRRQFPKTFNYLIKELNALELLGYNKVGDNTFPNLIPVFTGMFEQELAKTCSPNLRSHFDKCPFVWKNYSQQNYTTAFGEDCAWINLFNYLKKGFEKQPVDYYYTAFNREMENNIGHEKDFNCYQCHGSKQAYKSIIEYITKFTLRMKLESIPYFAFFWSNSLSHDYLNRPLLGDQDYFNLFKELNQSGRLENTIVIFMSDHGIRWGDIRKTYQGLMEERLPFVILTLPKWFKTDYPEAIANLKKNIRRLTTPFDLHETLKQLSDVDNIKNARKYDGDNRTMSRGFSLFKEIPATRTCQDAEITSHWCTCQGSSPIKVTDKVVVSAAKFVVNHINSQLKGYAQCATLTLEDIIEARTMTYIWKNVTTKASIRDYTITVKTIPGDALFEATIRLKNTPNEELESTTNQQNQSEFQEDILKDFTVTGTISRLTLYGKQSYCINDFHLKLYCYCKSLLPF